LRKKDEVITKMLNEKQKILGEILNIPHEDFDNIAEVSSSLHLENIFQHFCCDYTGGFKKRLLGSRFINANF
jgi:hypothetical protein